jgi:hypothetical protein
MLDPSCSIVRRSRSGPRPRNCNTRLVGRPKREGHADFKSFGSPIQDRIIRRDNGFFQYRTSEIREYNGEHQWLPTGTSGLYASFEDADRTASDELLDAERQH